MRWFAAAPARRLGLLRIASGGFAVTYLVARAPHLWGYGNLDAKRFDPVGVASLLGEPLPASLVKLLVVAAVAAGVGFTLGWRFRVLGPVFALLLLWVTTYRNSWGLVFHTENLMVLHVAILAIVPAADAHSLDERADRRRGPGGSSWTYGWPIRLLALVTCLTYFVAGWAKVRNGGFDWITGDVLRNHVAYDNVRKIQLGDPHSPFGGWLTQYRWLFVLLALGSMVVELGAPLAMLTRRLARGFVAIALLFHWSILAIMAILFPYHLLGIALLPFVHTEVVYDRIKHRLAKHKSHEATVGAH